MQDLSDCFEVVVASWASSFAVRQPKAPLGTSQASLRPSLSTKNIKCKPRYKTDIKYTFPTHNENQINRASHTQPELDHLLSYSTLPIACSTHYHHHHITKSPPQASTMELKNIAILGVRPPQPHLHHPFRIILTHPPRPAATSAPQS